MSVAVAMPEPEDKFNFFMTDKGILIFMDSFTKHSEDEGDS